jgi:hypothetical protein
MRRRVVPALGPLQEQHPASGRVHIGAAQLGVLDADQEPLGVHLAGEALGPLPARRIAVARPPPRAARALLLAAQVLDIAHGLPSTANRPQPTMAARGTSTR